MILLLTEANRLDATFYDHGSCRMHRVVLSATWCLRRLGPAFRLSIRNPGPSRPSDFRTLLLTETQDANRLKTPPHSALSRRLFTRLFAVRPFAAPEILAYCAQTIRNNAVVLQHASTKKLVDEARNLARLGTAREPEGLRRQRLSRFHRWCGRCFFGCCPATVSASETVFLCPLSSVAAAW